MGEDEVQSFPVNLNGLVTTDMEEWQQHSLLEPNLVGPKNELHSRQSLVPSDAACSIQDDGQSDGRKWHLQQCSHRLELIARQAGN